MQPVISASPASPSLKTAVRRLLLAIAILSVAGMVVSAVSLQHHYRKSKTAYCDIGENFNCDIVNRSEYSSILGVPVALIGILGYGTLLAFSTLYKTKAETPAVLLFAAVAGLAFALRLTYIEGFVLYTWCILCLTSLGLIFSIAALCAFVFRSSRDS